MNRVVPIKSLSRSETQTRAHVVWERAAEYAERMKAGDVFPLPIVFFDETTYWLADGFHRVEAAISNGRARIECDVRKGGKVDAILFGLSANIKHDKSGLHRSNADKREGLKQCILAMRELGENWSNRVLADKCGVSHEFVNKAIGGGVVAPKPAQNRRPESRQVATVATSTRGVIGKDGKEYKPREPKPTPIDKFSPDDEALAERLRMLVREIAAEAPRIQSRIVRAQVAQELSYALHQFRKAGR